MENINVIELFSGLGATRKALTNQKIKHNVLFLCDIDNLLCRKGI